jgi:hypothetical protein
MKTSTTLFLSLFIVLSAIAEAAYTSDHCNVHPVYMKRDTLPVNTKEHDLDAKKTEGKAQDHNSSRSNKTASSVAPDNNSGENNSTDTSGKAQDHNSSRSNKTASSTAPDSDMDNAENSLRGLSHNSTRSNRSSLRSPELNISIAPGISSPLAKSKSAQNNLYAASGFSNKLSAEYYFGRFGLGLSNGFLLSDIDQNSLGEKLSTLGYKPADVVINTSDAQNFFLMLGPSVSTGKRFKLAAEGRAGFFINSPGTVSAKTAEDGFEIVSISGGEKSLKPGFSGGISISYDITDQFSLGLNTDYLNSKTAVNSYDPKTRTSTINNVNLQNLTTALTVKIALRPGPSKNQKNPNASVVYTHPANNLQFAIDDIPEANDDNKPEEKEEFFLRYEKIEFRQLLTASRQENEDFRLTEAAPSIRISPVSGYTPDKKAETNNNPYFQNNTLGGEMPVHEPQGSSGSNPLYEQSKNEASNPLYEASFQPTNNPLHQSSGLEGNNPLYEEDEAPSNNPVYESGGNSTNNPLYEDKSKMSENPLFEQSGSTASNPLFSEYQVSVTGGKLYNLLLSRQLEVAAYETENLKHAYWFDCFPAATGLPLSGTTPEKANTIHSTIKQTKGIRLAGNRFAAEVIVETGGKEYDAIITGKLEKREK